MVKVTMEMPKISVVIDDLKNALIVRYLQPLEDLLSRADLDRFLEDRGMFHNPAILIETVEQFPLICARLNSLFREHGIVLGSDLSAQAMGMSDELAQYVQNRLPLSLPQVVVDESD